MDTQIGYEKLRYAVWTDSYSNQIPSRYAQNRIWANSLNEAKMSNCPKNMYHCFGMNNSLNNNKQVIYVLNNSCGNIYHCFVIFCGRNQAISTQILVMGNYAKDFATD